MYIAYFVLPISVLAFRTDPAWIILSSSSIKNCLFGIKCKPVFPV